MPASRAVAHWRIHTYSGAIVDNLVVGYPITYQANPQLEVAFLVPAETFSVSPATLQQCNPNPAPARIERIHVHSNLHIWFLQLVPIAC